MLTTPKICRCRQVRTDPNGYFVLYRCSHCSDSIPFPYFCIVQQPEVKCVSVFESGNVIKRLVFRGSPPFSSLLSYTFMMSLKTGTSAYYFNLYRWIIAVTLWYKFGSKFCPSNCHKGFFKNILEDIGPFVVPLVLPFWTSGKVCWGSQIRANALTCLLYHLCDRFHRHIVKPWRKRPL